MDWKFIGSDDIDRRGRLFLDRLRFSKGEKLRGHKPPTPAVFFYFRGRYISPYARAVGQLYQAGSRST